MPSAARVQNRILSDVVHKVVYPFYALGCDACGAHHLPKVQNCFDTRRCQPVACVRPQRQACPVLLGPRWLRRQQPVHIQHVCPAVRPYMPLHVKGCRNGVLHSVSGRDDMAAQVKRLCHLGHARLQGWRAVHGAAAVLAAVLQGILSQR